MNPAGPTCQVIGSADGDARSLSALLGAEFVATPAGDDAAWEQWREGLAQGARPAAIVVALLPPLAERGEIVETGAGGWSRRAEEPLVQWTFALGAAAVACADGGAIVSVVDGPPPLDSAGLAPEAAVAEAVEALTRSIAMSEGGRGVRANCLVTPSRLVPAPIIAPIPPLAGFPGTLEEDVAGSVRMLLSADAAWLSGRSIAVDRGRSW